MVALFHGGEESVHVDVDDFSAALVHPVTAFASPADPMNGPPDDAFTIGTCASAIRADGANGHAPSGRGMNSSSSPGTFPNRPARQSALACSMRSRLEETKFQNR